MLSKRNSPSFWAWLRTTLRRRLHCFCFCGSFAQQVKRKRQFAETATRLRRLSFSLALEEKAGPLPQITAADCRVFEDGNNQNLTGLRLAEGQPLAVGILLDGSLQNRAFARTVPSGRGENRFRILEGRDQVADKSFWIKFAESSPNLAGIIDLSDRAGMQQAVDSAEVLRRVPNF